MAEYEKLPMLAFVDPFDVAEGLSLWLEHNWGGKSCPLYAAYCRLTAPGMFKARPSLTLETLEPEGREVYDALTPKNYGHALARVLNYSPTEGGD